MSQLSDVEVFVAVVREHGFTAAARLLGLSKARVSQAVAGLEERLGARLLARTTRRLSLTEAGETFYRRASPALEALEDASAAVAELQAAPRGTLRVTLPMSFGLRYVADAIAQFLALHPGLEVVAHYGDRVVDIVEEGYDLAIRGGQLQDSTLRARRLVEVGMVLVASPAYLDQYGTPASPTDLAQHRCLVYDLSKSPQQWPFVDPHGREVAVRVSGPLVANSGDALNTACLLGAGIAYQPIWLVADDVRAGRLVALCRDWKSPALAVWAVYPGTREPPAKVRLFIDFLADRLAPLEHELGCPGGAPGRSRSPR